LDISSQLKTNNKV